MVPGEVMAALTTMSLVAAALPFSVIIPSPAVNVAFTSTSPVITMLPPVPGSVLIPWSTVILPAVELTVTASPLVAIPDSAPTVPIDSPSGSRNAITPSVVAAIVSTSLLVLALNENDPLGPVLSSSSPLPVIAPVAACVAPFSSFRSSVTRPVAAWALIAPSSVIAPSLSVSPKPESKVTSPPMPVACTTAVLSTTTRSPASMTTSPPADSTVTPAFTVTLSKSTVPVSMA